MKKKILTIVISISVVLVVIFILLNVSRQYKVSVQSRGNYLLNTCYAISNNTESWYEIDLKKKIVDVRKNSIPTLAGIESGKAKFYYRKLEYRKILTDEECNQLQKIFDKAINGIDIDLKFEQEQNLNFEQEQNLNLDFLNPIIDSKDYIIDSIYIKDVVMCDEDEVLFEKIVEK